MRFLLILIALTSLACEGCQHDEFSSPPIEEAGDVITDVEAVPLVVLHYTEDASVVGPAFNNLFETVPAMHGPQGGGAFLPFLAVNLPESPLSKGRVDLDIRVVYLKTGRVQTSKLKHQLLEETEDPDYPESLVYWGYVGLNPKEFDQSSTLEMSIKVTLSDEFGNAVTDFCPVIRVKDGSESD